LSLYFLHTPLRDIAVDGFGLVNGGGTSGVLATTAVIAGCILLAPFTEHRYLDLRAWLLRRV